MNRLLEVYSRGLYDSLNNESIADVVEHFQNISNDSSVHGLGDLFKNKTVQKTRDRAAKSFSTSKWGITSPLHSATL